LLRLRRLRTFLRSLRTLRCMRCTGWQPLFTTITAVTYPVSRSGEEGRRRNSGEGGGLVNVTFWCHGAQTTRLLIYLSTAVRAILSCRQDFPSRRLLRSFPQRSTGEKPRHPNTTKSHAGGGRLPPPLTVETPKYKQQRNKHQTYIITVLNIMVPL